MPHTPNAVERKRKNIIQRMEREKERKELKSGERAVKRAKRAGVELDPTLRCGYAPVTIDDENWIFGPDRDKDNIFQAVPQVSLHGFDEGLVQKMNFGAIEMVVKHCIDKHGMKEAQVFRAAYESTKYFIFALIYYVYQIFYFCGNICYIR